jgi:hypothetical protein
MGETGVLTTAVHMQGTIINISLLNCVDIR